MYYYFYYRNFHLNRIVSKNYKYFYKIFWGTATKNLDVFGKNGRGPTEEDPL